MAGLRVLEVKGNGGIGEWVESRDWITLVAVVGRVGVVGGGIALSVTLVT